MPLELIRNDITKMHVDAIVSPTNPQLISHGGVSGAIFRAAGPMLENACRMLGGCSVGEAKITPAYSLPCKWVIHTVGPRWQDGQHGEPALLTACYQNTLKEAWRHRCSTVAFPLIASGTYGYPKEQALRTAMAAIGDSDEAADMLVYLVVFDKMAFGISQELYQGVAQYIDDHYADARKLRRQRWEESQVPCEADLLASGGGAGLLSLEEMLEELDESFSHMVLRKIDEKNMKDADCYKRANIDRKLFSKIRIDDHYKPSKRTALALAVALELSLEETGDLLMKAGYALSHSDKFDVVVEYFIVNRMYDVLKINEVLYGYDLPRLGS